MTPWHLERLSLCSEPGSKFIYDGWNLIAEARVHFRPRDFVCLGLDLTARCKTAGGGGPACSRWIDQTGGLAPSSTQPYYDGNGNVHRPVNRRHRCDHRLYEYSAFGETFAATAPSAQGNPFRFSSRYPTRNRILYYGRNITSEVRTMLAGDPMRKRWTPLIWLLRK